MKKTTNCDVCGAEYEEQHRKTKSNKRMCPECRHKAEHKECPVCGGVFKKRDHESFTEFGKRVCCSRKCSNEARKRAVS